MEVLECSVWSNGGNGWGLRILGGSTTGNRYFSRDRSPIHIELDGRSFSINVDKDSFLGRRLPSTDQLGFAGLVRPSRAEGRRSCLARSCRTLSLVQSTLGPATTSAENGSLESRLRSR